MCTCHFCLQSNFHLCGTFNPQFLARSKSTVTTTSVLPCSTSPPTPPKPREGRCGNRTSVPSSSKTTTSRSTTVSKQGYKKSKKSLRKHSRADCRPPSPLSPSPPPTPSPPPEAYLLEPDWSF